MRILGILDEGFVLVFSSSDGWFLLGLVDRAKMVLMTMPS